jgi:hypothetical protein
MFVVRLSDTAAMCKLTIALILLTACVFSLTGCSKKAAPTEPSTSSTVISGIVSDSLGNPVPGAYVSVSYYFQEGTSLKGATAKACSLHWFVAGFGHGKTTLHWQDTLETNIMRWDIQRSFKGSVLSYQVIASVTATGTSNTMNDYSYRDSNGTNGNILYYLLDEVELTGNHVFHGPCIIYHQSVQTNALGRYTFLKVPVDTLIPVFNSSGLCIRTDTIGTSYVLWADKDGHSSFNPSAQYHSVIKNVMNTINLTLH